MLVHVVRTNMQYRISNDLFNNKVSAIVLFVV